MYAEEVVQSCLNFMGPLELTEEATKSAIIDHVSRNGLIKFGDKSSRTRSQAEERIAEILALVAASKEYQRA
jgi:hypothetical protein